MQSLRNAAQSLIPSRQNMTADVIAGLTFAVVNVPQAMAHALLATVNPVLGIYTLMVAVPMGALFTSSVFMNVSTTSALSVAAGAGLSGIPAAQRVEALAVLTLMIGIFQLLAGLFRLGSFTRFVSNAVMTGFLNGVAVLIILGQLGDLTGYRSQYGNSVARALDLLLNLGQINVPTTIIGGLTLAGIVALMFTRLKKFAFIIAIATATILLVVLQVVAPAMFASGAVQRVGDVASIPRSLPQLALPQPSLVVTLLLPALSIAMIGLIQGAGVSQGTPNPDGKYPNVSRDFLGQGVANIATSFVGGVPAGGSISGTILMMGAGARSRWANIFAGVLVGVVVLLAAPLVEFIPMPALAALLIVAGFQGLRIAQTRMILRTGAVPATNMIITFIATLIMPLQYAVLLGVALSVVLQIARQSNKVTVAEWELQQEGFPVEKPAPKKLPSNQLTVLHVYGSLFFAGAKSFEEMLPAVDDTTHAAVILSLRGNTEVGSTFITVLTRYAESLRAHNSKLMLVGVDNALRFQLTKTGVINLIGYENVFLATPQLGESLNAAIAAGRAWLGHDGSALKSG